MKMAEMYQGVRRKVSDMVREMVATRRPDLTAEEEALAVHLRGNVALYSALMALIQTRIGGRANLPEPSDPLVAKSMLARDRELQWLLKVLEHVHLSPVSQSADRDGEQPA